MYTRCIYGGQKLDNSVIGDLTIFMVGNIFENSNVDNWNVTAGIF